MKRQRRVAAAAPRIFIYTGAPGALQVYGSRGGPGPLQHGAHVDFDAVLGDCDGRPVTFEELVGAHAQTCFRPATPAPAPIVTADDEE